MKYITTILILMLAICANAQSNKPVFVKGTLGIQYNSRVKSGAPDVYTLDLNYSDSAVFRGTITNIPLVNGTFSISQNASLIYQLDCDVVNPSNPTDRRNIGRMFGRVPISPDGVYDFSNGGLKVTILPMGRAAGFDSAYSGTASGRPLIKPKGWLDSLKGEVQNLTRNINGKNVTIAVKKYDKMVFNGHRVSAGPIQLYPEATANGGMLYDYDRFAWHFQDVTINYSVDGVLKADKVTGSIRWTEKKPNGSIRDGEYVFDVRVNEPAGEAFAGTATASSEASFFETDTTIPSLTGTMKYRDTMSGEKVMSSAVTIDLKGNQLTRQQGMNLTKLILLTSIVPINAE